MQEREETHSEPTSSISQSNARNKKLTTKMLAYLQDQKQMTGEKQKTVKKFRELHSFLEKQEKRLLDQIEEVEKEIATTRDQHWAELSKEHSHLDSLIQEIQEKCQQPASDLLWVRVLWEQAGSQLGKAAFLSFLHLEEK
uniref:Uncharacterized protein n=1 Tax=Sphaerodactylus townsendi TaxID=933632 RepID=A0ACB8EFU5_9SAUR